MAGTRRKFNQDRRCPRLCHSAFRLHQPIHGSNSPVRFRAGRGAPADLLSADASHDCAARDFEWRPAPCYVCPPVA